MLDVVAPSFFPTPIEFAAGIRWVKEHPVVATAAVTAVSVITYLMTAAEGERKLTIAYLHPEKNPLDDQSSSTESDSSSLSRNHTLSLRNLSLGEFDADVAEEDSNEQKCHAQDVQNQADWESKSPQWGWYVSTTPPEEYHQ
ncbi:uncharacterized protein PHALS_01206 [Plasmopara halstedii]|uniref:Uncharacterized protein n=1 Tax=Plasmopara halstedii TaxID=4781 RepID=A0A0N7L6P8_PLAHL|nr:uncharacterized protein PHALS_01206 [Plasmopara halstedii]CEG44875.1 hypothetical protein PHALS_01206 [Plasmopara halstedii]|eukprot:XP_024581244.1 hypothetical protein PHALS_01206 [Plasmopara halstedii]